MGQTYHEQFVFPHWVSMQTESSKYNWPNIADLIFGGLFGKNY